MRKEHILGEILALAIENKFDLSNFLVERKFDIFLVLNRLLEFNILSKERYREINLLLIE